MKDDANGGEILVTDASDATPQSSMSKKHNRVNTTVGQFPKMADSNATAKQSGAKL